METQQELGHDPAGTALKMCETAARSAPWEVGTRATVPRPAWISSQDTASAPALLVLDLDPPLLRALAFSHTGLTSMRGWLSSFLSLTPLDTQERLRAVWGSLSQWCLPGQQVLVG